MGFSSTNGSAGARSGFGSSDSSCPSCRSIYWGSWARRGGLTITRRRLGYQPYFIVAAIGVCIIATGTITQVWQIIVSIKERKQNLDTTGDPWDGRTLEWMTPSPVPFYSFAKTPTVDSRDAFWEMKKQGKVPGRDVSAEYEDIELTKNTGMAIYLSGLVFVCAFGLVWHIIWLAAVGLIGSIACVIIRSFDEDTEYILPAADVEKLETMAWNNK